MNKKNPNRHNRHKGLLKSKRHHKDHIKQRFKERFGIDLTNSKWKAIVNRIKNGNANFLKNSHSGRKVYGVHVDGTYVHVVYDPTVDGIVTTLDMHGEKACKERLENEKGDKE